MHWVDIWDSKNCWSYRSNDFIGKTCLKRSRHFWSNALFVNLTNIQHRGLPAYCNRLKIRRNRFNTSRWISLHTYRLAHVGMMLFLASSIAFLVYVVSSHVLPHYPLLIVLSFFGSIGSVNSVCRRKLLATATRDLLVTFGRNSLNYYNVKLHCHQLTTRKLMV